MKVIVVGSGIGGTSAAYHCAKDGHEVLLLEKEPQIGGHTLAIDIDDEKVDLGFMMFGDSNPNIKAWFKSFGITNEDGTTNIRIPMSMSVSSDIPNDLQFSSRRPFSSVSDLTSTSLWNILYDIYKFTLDLLYDMPVKDNTVTTAEWAAKSKYSPEFFRHYFLPFVAILWTIPKKDVMTLPASQFLRCLKTHANSLYIPLWQVLLGALGRRVDRPKHLWWYAGSAYLEPFKKFFNSKNKCSIECNASVQSVGRNGKSVTLTDGRVFECDKVVLATHGEISAKLLSQWASPETLRSLNRFVFHKNQMYVHRDPKFLPSDKRAWSSWNVRIVPTKTSGEGEEYIMTYWMNRIQRLKSKDDVFVTIVPSEGYDGMLPEPESIISTFPWDHPRLLADCIPQDEIMKEEGVVLSGAWLGRGFHEDGFVAGRRAAAIVNDSAVCQTELYCDEGNIPTPAVPEFGMPTSLKVGLVTTGVLVLASTAAVLNRFLK